MGLIRYARVQGTTYGLLCKPEVRRTSERSHCKRRLGAARGYVVEKYDSGNNRFVYIDGILPDVYGRIEGKGLIKYTEHPKLYRVESRSEATPIIAKRA